MGEKYSSITELLKSNSGLSLDLSFSTLNYGITNARCVKIQEPNPHEGEIANPGDGEQQYLHGPRQSKLGYDFRARDSHEGLDLLARACAGEVGLKNTVNASFFQSKAEQIHGYPTGQGGLDDWLFQEFMFAVSTKDQKLVAELTSYHFGAVRMIVASQTVDSVAEAVALYQNNRVDTSTLKSLQTGILLNHKIKHHARWEFTPRINDPKIFAESFVKEYEAALKELAPFQINKEAQKGLFISMVLENLYI